MQATGTWCGRCGRSPPTNRSSATSCEHCSGWLAFVLADTAGRHDTELVRLFHKRNLRAQMLLGPANSAMTHHHAIQKF